MDKKLQFYPTIIEEQETHISYLYDQKVVEIYTSRKSVYLRLYKKLGEPNENFLVHGKISGARWIIPFSNRKEIKIGTSLGTTIGQMS